MELVETKVRVPLIEMWAIIEYGQGRERALGGKWLDSHGLWEKEREKNSDNIKDDKETNGMYLSL